MSYCRRLMEWDISETQSDMANGGYPNQVYLPTRQLSHFVPTIRQGFDGMNFLLIIKMAMVRVTSFRSASQRHACLEKGS